PLKAVRQNRETAVELAPRHASSVVLTCEEPPLQIAREPVRAVGRLEIDGHAIARRVFHAPIVVDIGEQEVAALLPPERPLGGSQRAAEAGCQFLDRLVHGDDLVELRRKPLNAWLHLRLRLRSRARPRSSAPQCAAPAPPAARAPRAATRPRRRVQPGIPAIRW